MAHESHPDRPTFQEVLDRTVEFVEATMLLNSTARYAEAAETILSVRRIFCTASGSSVPAAWFLAMGLVSDGLHASFVGTSELLEVDSLSSSDAVVLVSQGFDRSDAIIIAEFAKSRSARFILITAKDSPPDEFFTLKFAPTGDYERLFCRPAGVLTCFSVVARLRAMLRKDPWNPVELVGAIKRADTCFESMDTNVLKALTDAELVVILGSGALLPAAHNIALALREGASKIAEHYEIEYYAHGQYAPHLNAYKAGTPVCYILLTSDCLNIPRMASERIRPLLSRTQVPCLTYEAHGRQDEANVELLRLGGLLVQHCLGVTGYDMNQPFGKLENLAFHEVGADYYEINKKVL